MARGATACVLTDDAHLRYTHGGGTCWLREFARRALHSRVVRLPASPQTTLTPTTTPTAVALASFANSQGGCLLIARRATSAPSQTTPASATILTEVALASFAHSQGSGYLIPETRKGALRGYKRANDGVGYWLPVVFGPLSSLSPVSCLLLCSCSLLQDVYSPPGMEGRVPFHILFSERAQFPGISVVVSSCVMFVHGRI